MKSSKKSSKKGDMMNKTIGELASRPSEKDEEDMKGRKKMEKGWVGKC